MKIELNIWNRISGYTRLSHYTLKEDELLEIIKNHLIQTGYLEQDELERIDIESVTV